MEQLASASGVSSKTISLYEHTPPKRPSRKVVDKLSEALDISPDILLGTIGTRAKPPKGAPAEPEPGSIELEDIEVVRILILVERELQELNELMVEAASLVGSSPALGRSIDYFSNDIDLLAGIRQKLSQA